MPSGMRSVYEEAGAKVLGVSPDSVASHRKFADKFGLPFTLLADPDKTVCNLYGVYKEKTLMGRIGLGVERTTVVIDRAGTIAKIFPKVKVDGHAEEVLKAIQAVSK